MRINGKHIGTLKGRANDTRNLIDRILEVYETETKIKFYLFNSATMEWHKENNVLCLLEVKKLHHLNVTDAIHRAIKGIMFSFEVKLDGAFKYNDDEIIYRFGSEAHKVTNGFWLKDMSNEVLYFGEFVNDNKFYKDEDAWINNKGVIYISEAQLEDIHAEYQTYKTINKYDLWTKESWVKWVKETILDNYEGCYETYDDITEDEYNRLTSDEKFFEYVAYLCFQNCEWQDLSTYFIENENCEPWVLFTWDEWKKKKMKNN